MDLRGSWISIDKRWSLLGVVLAIVFGGLTVYAEFIRDRRPDLKFEVVSNTSVLDVREELGKLEIFYDGLDIMKSKQSLRVVVVRVVNPGETDILMGHYDERVPLGFTVSNGELLRVELLEASNGYLMSNMRVLFTDDLQSVFAPVIIESKEFFTFKALILHSQGEPPVLSPQGKIAGIRTISLSEQISAENDQSYWHLVFSGGVLVQASRLISYFFGLILLLFAIISPIVYVSGKFTRRKRAKHIKHFRRVTGIELQDKDEFIFSEYMDNGHRHVKAMSSLLTNKTKLKEVLDELPDKGVESKNRNSGVSVPDIPLHFPLSPEIVVHALMRKNVIQRKGDSWEEDSHTVETIIEFDRFLSIIL